MEGRTKKVAVSLPTDFFDGSKEQPPKIQDSGYSPSVLPGHGHGQNKKLDENEEEQEIGLSEPSVSGICSVTVYSSTGLLAFFRAQI